MLNNKTSKLNRGEGVIRQSNIELCRILSMFLIVLLHSTYASFGYPIEYSRPSILILLFSSISIIGVDVFLLISGYFSIKPKKESVISLLIICLFGAICKIVLGWFIGSFDWHNLLFISNSNWFIISYFGLLILSPILNSYIDSASSKNLGIVIISFYCFNVYFSIFPAMAAIEPGFNNGCSVLWFIEMYLIGRYLKIYGIPKVMQKYTTLIFISCVSFLFFGQIALLEIGFGSHLSWFGAQNQPLVLLAAVSFFTFFAKLSFQSKIINHIAQSTLLVLLLHSPGLTKMYFQRINTGDNIVINAVLWLFGVAAIYAICTIVDQIRLNLKKLVLTKNN